jgi:hypothetical protein
MLTERLVAMTHPFDADTGPIPLTVCETISVHPTWVEKFKIREGSRVLDRHGNVREVLCIEPRVYVGGEKHMQLAYYRLHLD